MSRHTEDGSTYRRLRRQFLAEHPVCWICGHSGADQIDHDPPQAVHRTKLDLTTWRPAHGTNGCTTCRRRCNQERGTKPHVQVFTPRLDW